jgi:CHAT domain-containing protein
MSYKKLALKLISARNQTERKKLIDLDLSKAKSDLAFALKDICWEAWTSNPVVARRSALALEVLSKTSQNEMVSALHLWVSAIAELTKGKLENATKIIDESESIFLSIAEPHLAAQTQVSKLYILALLGRYEEAIVCGKKALNIFLKLGDEIEAGKIENNLGNIVSRQESHYEAEKYYRSARDRFEKCRDSKQLVMSENGLAITFAALNNFREAEKSYSKALRYAEENGMFLRQAEIEGSIGTLSLFRGKFDKALLYLEQSRQKFEELKMSYQVSTAELEIADVYLELNLTNDAIGIYQKTSRSFRHLKMQGEEAHSRANLGKAAFLSRDFRTARSELKKSRRLFISENNPSGAAFVNLLEAEIEIIEKKYTKAYNLVLEAEHLLENTSNVRYNLIASWLKAECFVHLKDARSAEQILSTTFADAIEQENTQIAQFSKTSLGRLAMTCGDSKKAKQHFEEAVELIETLRDPLPADEFRMAFLSNKLLPYHELAKICLDEKRVEDAFQYVESSRSRSLVESISVENNSKIPSKSAEKLNQKLQDLREELNWFYSKINRAAEQESLSLQNAAKLREKEISDVQRKLNSIRGISTQKQKNFDFAKIQKSIGIDKALLEFIEFDDCFSVFVVTEKEIHFIRKIAKVSEISALLEKLHFQFDSLKYGAKLLESFVSGLKKRADIYLNRLYEKLIVPVESLIGNRKLIFSPVGKLHYVPFNALFDGSEYLIQKTEVSLIPSATVLLHCLSKPQRRVKNALLIGFADESIPLVNKEIFDLSKIFSEKMSFVKSEATFANFRKHAENFDILHIACHGNFRQDNPMFSSLRLSDGWVTVRDACGMNLKAELVTLSACETGINSIFAGEELLGLSRGFLSAGANSLLLTLWNVNDEVTQALMADFYASVLNGKTFGTSLRIAQCNAIRQNMHPYYWSPFVLIGRS